MHPPPVVTEKNKTHYNHHVGSLALSNAFVTVCLSLNLHKGLTQVIISTCRLL